MSERTKIEWCDSTWSPWRGCTKVSPGCANCYAEVLSRRNPKVLGEWGRGKPRVLNKDWDQVRRWNRGPFSCGSCGKPFVQLTGRQKLCEPIPGDPCHNCNSGRYAKPRVFPSLCDWLDDEVPVEWLADFLRLIHETPNVDWLLLTKRPENWRVRMDAALPHCGDSAAEWVEVWTDCLDMPERGDFPANVWLGVSVEDQTRADERIPVLLQTPARVRFLSVEPLLGPVDLLYAAFDGGESVSAMGGLDWVIAGGESGSKSRPCNTEWIRSIVRQCKAAAVPCFVKQLGANVVDRNDAGFEGEGPTEWPMDTHTRDLDPSVYQGSPVNVILRDRKGGDPAEWPEDLRVRQMPEVKP